jgi:hypothetical protein
MVGKGMFRIPVTVVVCAFLLLASAIPMPARAQVPNIQVFQDPVVKEQIYHCGTAGTTAQLFVVLSDVNFVVSAVDFQIEYPSSMIWLADLLPDDSWTGTELVTIGSSPTGVAIAFANCCMLDGSQGPVVVMRALVSWAENCTCAPILIGGYSPLGKTQPSVVRGSDFAEFPVVGVHTNFDPYVCPTPVQPTTWGRVKALYR